MQSEKMKIIAVDDEELVLRLLDGTLKNLGFNDVDFARSGSEALKKIEKSQSPYDCFLLDIRMPGMDGLELCKRIRSMPAHRQTPIIMLTAQTETHFVEQSFAAGATDYLTKPIDKVELGARLRVAEMLRSEQAKAHERARSGGAVQLSAPYPAEFELNDAITLHDVPRVINALALENYLLQLSRNDAFRHAAIGFQIEKVTALFRRETPSDFYYMLADVADVIFESIRHVDPLIAYFGNGSFVAVVPRVNSLDPEELGPSINAELGHPHYSTCLSQNPDLFVSVGAQINSSMFGRKAGDLILRAIESAQPVEQHTPKRRSGQLLRALTA